MNVYMKDKGQVYTYTLTNSAISSKKNKLGKEKNPGVQLRKSRFMEDTQVNQFRSDNPNQVFRYSSFKGTDFASPDRSVGGEVQIDIKLSKGDPPSSSGSSLPQSLQGVERQD